MTGRCRSIPPAPSPPPSSAGKASISSPEIRTYTYVIACSHSCSIIATDACTLDDEKTNQRDYVRFVAIKGSQRRCPHAQFQRNVIFGEKAGRLLLRVFTVRSTSWVRGNRCFRRKQEQGPSDFRKTDGRLRRNSEYSEDGQATDQSFCSSVPS